MNESPSGARACRRARPIGIAMIVLAGAAVLAAPVAAAEGEEEIEQADGIIDALIGGKPTLDVRGRIELARADGLARSEAYTLRTRLGYGTRPWYGLRLYAEFENIAAATTSTYFDPTKIPNTRGQTPIAEHPTTEVNQGLLEINRPDWLGSKLVGGRQRIIYDDARFIGNVGWRQNEQTYDAVQLESSGGLVGFSGKYSWLGHVNRIFGGGGNNPALADFDSSSHLLNASYTATPELAFTAFAYLLGLENSRTAAAGASSMSFGFRARGLFDLGEEVDVDYTVSYAYQADYADNPADYGASYVDAELGLRLASLARLAVGFEMLGSDGGTQQFLTPLATAHKFNGWADVYLNNGGPAGLRDMRLILEPALPWKLKMSLIYHRFWDDASSTLRGNEFDAVLKRSFGKHLVVLAKGAYFDSATDRFAEVDTWRFWFDITVKF